MALDSVLIRQGLQNGDVITKVGNKPFDRLDPGVFVEAWCWTMSAPPSRSSAMARNSKSSAAGKCGRATHQPESTESNAYGAPHSVCILETVPGKPAASAGLQKGDRIIAFNGQSIPFFDQFAPLAQQQKEKSVTLGILRGSDTLQVPVTLTDAGLIGVKTQIEGYFKEEREKYSFLQAMPAGVQMGMDFLNSQLKAFGQMFRGKIAVKDNLGSLISIGKMYGPVWDWERFWHMTASLSIILAFMNLLPIPALDGGYVMFLLWEVVTGRQSERHGSWNAPLPSAFSCFWR